MSEDLDIIDQNPVEAETLVPVVAGEFDVQVATAKKFPRYITRSFDNAKAIATMSEATARTCGYLVPRAGKNITGASVHLARILAQSWGNLRVSQQVVGEEDRFVICEAVAWDLETNLAIKTQVKKRITDKYGKRYNDDMIAVTGNAGMAIAFRNSIFSVIPKSIVDGCYEATRRKITGDLTTEDKLVAKRKEVLLVMEKNWGVDERQVLTFFKFNQVTQIKQDEIVQLIDLMQSFKDGDTTPDQVFGNTLSQAQSQNISEKLTGKKPVEPKVEPKPEPEPAPIVPEPQPKSRVDTPKDMKLM
jgi:hypothetical protein